MLFSFTKRKSIIKKSLMKTVTEFSERTPKIHEHFFYGSFNVQPQYLVIWYLFETDAELENAKQSGLCNELEEATIKNLIDFGYPKEAFETTNMGTPAKITFCGGTEEQQKNILHSLTYRKASVCFTTKEDIDNKTNGDYRLYFQ